MTHAQSPNGASGYGTSCIHPNPRYARTSDMRQPLGDISDLKIKEEDENACHKDK
jgi:hypothetical protein